MALHPTINILSLCSGIGGFDLGVSRAIKRLGFSPRVVCYVEGEAYAASILVKQMEAGNLDQAPVWSDLKTFDCDPWRGKVDLVIGGYPCQPFSFAGKRRGKEDPRHLWPHVLRVLIESRATLLFCENVRGHTSKGLREVLGQVSCFGFNAEWDVFSAEEEGAPHRRERLFIFAHANSAIKRKQPRGWGRSSGKSETITGNHSAKELVANSYGQGLHVPVESRRLESQVPKSSGFSWWASEPSICRVAHGTPSRLERVRALGNAVVPQSAERAFVELWERSLG